jgi:NADH:ubiquinone reductase (H+-translocating)
MLYTPSLPHVTAGPLSPPHVVVPLRQMCPHAELLVGRARALDEGANEVEVETDAGRFRVRYEQLVVAVGAVTRPLPIPGLTEHALGFKTVADAMYLRNHVLRQLEAASAELDPERAEQRLGFVFVGAGYAGVEALAELFDFVGHAIRYYPALRERRQRWVLVDAAASILPEIHPPLSAYAAKLLASRGVEIRVSTTLQSVDAHAVVLGDGERVATRTVVWTAGVTPSPLVAELGLPTDDRGQLRVEPTLRVEGRQNVWALGDCARVENEATPERPDPPTCQHALRQARRLARNLQGQPKPYRYKMIGEGATLGRRRGIAQILGVRMKGIVAWWAVQAYHLYQLPLTRRKLRVLLAWLLTPLVQREVAELGTIGQRTPIGSE